jgi:hypothetical protein
VRKAPGQANMGVWEQVRHIAYRLSSAPHRIAMSAHPHDHFPSEAEQNEIGGPVLAALMTLFGIVLIIWAIS